MTVARADLPRVLLFVTTRKDAEITSRLLHDAGLAVSACETLDDLAREIGAGADSLVITEERVPRGGEMSRLIRLLHPFKDGVDLPTVLLTQGGTHSLLPATLQNELPNLRILERPAPISSIISAVQSAVRVTGWQRQMRQSLARITDLQNQLTLALEASELGTFHCPLPLGPVVWNDQCKRHFWLPPDAEVDMERFYALLHPDDRDPVRQAVEACVLRGAKFDVEYRTVSPGGRTRWIRAAGRTLADDRGRPVQFLGTTQDISARKALEEERDRLLESERAARLAAERANRLKDEFLATLSHELRTPLNAITGWLELMREEIDHPETIREGLAVLERNTRAQAQLINDLLDVSRIVSGKVRLELRPLALFDVLQSALDTVRPAAVARGVKLEPVSGGPGPQVMGDFGRLQQVFWNLLSNAVKFTPEHGLVRTIIHPLPATVCVSIMDTGEGMAPEFLPHVFERFRQADGSTVRKHRGLGLGLSIVKSLVEMHGGTIQAESAGRGRGATFRVHLPLRAILQETPEAEAITPPAPEHPLVAPALRPDLAGMRVLVVDDESDARTMMRRLLLACRAIPVEAASAAAALELLADFKPDVIVSDIGMPELDGHRFMREVRQRGVHVPAVALTAFARAEDRTRSLDAGFQAHLSKPIAPAELLAVIARLTGRAPALSGAAREPEVG